MVGAYQTNALPLRVLFDNLQRGEIVSPDYTFEEFDALLGDEGPSFTQPNEEGVDDGEEEEGA